MDFQHLIVSIKSVATKAAVAGCVIALAGCAGVQKTKLDEATVKNVNKVVLIPINQPDRVAVTNYGGAMLFGAIGGAVQGSINDSHSTTYSGALDAAGVHLAPAFEDTLLAGLRAKGLSADLVVQPVKTASDGTYDVSGVQTDADAILLLKWSYMGYMSGTSDNGYLPWTDVEATLLDRQSHVLYQQRFSAWRKPTETKIEWVKVPGKFEYGDFDTLMAHVPESAEGVKLGNQAIAQHLLDELKMGPATPTTALGQPAAQ